MLVGELWNWSVHDEEAVGALDRMTRMERWRWKRARVVTMSGNLGLRKRGCVQSTPSKWPRKGNKTAQRPPVEETDRLTPTTLNRCPHSLQAAPVDRIEPRSLVLLDKLLIGLCKLPPVCREWMRMCDKIELVCG